MSRDQNTGQSINIMIDNNFFERVEQFIYLVTTLRNLNSIQEEIKSGLSSGNAFCHSWKNLLFSSLLSKSIKIKIHRIIILPVLYGCETWSLTLMEKCRLRVLQNRMLRRIFEPKRDEITGERRKLHNEELNDSTPHPVLFG